MKMKLIIGVVLSLVLLGACSSYEECPAVQEPNRNTEVAVGHVSVNTVCSMLNRIIDSSVVQSASTRNVTVSPANIMAYNAQGELLTRTEDQEARYYLVTIPELEMYAITGAHTTVPPLLVLAEGVPQTGYLHFEDELEDHVVNLPNNLESIIIPGTPVVPIDTTTLNQPIKVYDYENASYTLLNDVQPINLQWRQHAPYNMCNPSSEDGGEYYEHAAVCCIAMSMAMVMSHHRYRPELTINGQLMDWEKIWNYKYYGIEFEYPELLLLGVLENQLAPLFTRLCTDLDVEWGEDTSWGSAMDIKPVFSSYNIDVANENEAYAFEKMENEIGQGYPVIMSGYEPSKYAGHVWVCSAVLYADVPYKVVLYVEPPFGGVSEDELILETGVSHFALLHHNWGWNPKCTGYYLNAEKIVSGQDIFFDESFDVVKLSNKHSGWGTYQDFRIWTGIRKMD